MEEGSKRASTFAAKSGGFLGHGVEHGEDFFVVVEKLIVSRVVKIVAGEGEFEPSLSLGCFLAGIAQFIDEDSFVSSLAPSLGKVRAHGSR